MCQFKSGLILKDRVFIPDYDSHQDMLSELKIEDNQKNAENLFVRAELVPKDGDVFTDPETWNFNVDQDIVPEWFVKDYEKQRMIAAVKEWAKTHIYDGVDGLRLSSGSGYCVRNCKDVVIYGSATVKNICDSATVKNICGSATVEHIYGSATVKYICGSATVNYICGSATVKNICDSATVKNICGSATVEYAKGYSTIIGSKYGWDKKSLIICENATFKDCKEKVIYQAGDWKFAEVESE